MKTPQVIHGHERGLRTIPTPANGDFLITALHQVSLSLDLV
jgi:hypothetical protein